MQEQLAAATAKQLELSEQMVELMVRLLTVEHEAIDFKRTLERLFNQQERFEQHHLERFEKFERVVTERLDRADTKWQNQNDLVNAELEHVRGVRRVLNWLGPTGVGVLVLLGWQVLQIWKP